MRTTEVSVQFSALVACLILLGIELAPSIANAGNDAGIYYGQQAIMTGGAVRAIVNDGSSIVYNPAGLGRIDCTVLNVSLNAYQFRTQKLDDVLILAGERGFGTRGTELTPVPTSLSLTRPFGENWVIGVGLFTTNFQTTDFALRAESVSDIRTFEANVDIQVKDNSFNAGIGAGARISDRTTLGFSIVFPRVNTKYSSTYSTSFTASNDEQGSARSTHTKSEVIGIGAIFGGIFSVGESWKLSTVVESPVFRVINSSRFHSSTFDTSIIDGSLDDYRSEMTDEVNSINAGAVMSYLRTHLGAAYESDRWVFTVGGDVKLADSLSTRRNVDVVLNGRAGLQYLTPPVRLGFGVFTDRTRSSSSEREQFKSLQFLGGSFAAQFGEEYGLADDSPAESSAVTVSTTVGLRYAYGYGDFEPRVFQFGTPSDEGFGRSRQTVHEAALYIATRLDF